jgi:hypothetical protein
MFKGIPTINKVGGSLFSLGYDGMYGMVNNPFLWMEKEKVNVICGISEGKFASFNAIEISTY